MDCKIIETWLLKDYLDGELGPAKLQALESHLKTCRACSDFLQEAKTTIVRPFEDTKQHMPQQEYLWNRIKAKIEEEPKQYPKMTLERIIRSFRAPKPIFALSTCAALILAVFVLTQARALYQKTYNRQLAATALTEQLEYFASDEITSFGTDAENYFL